MYCSHFGLHRHPFNNTPDPSFYYSTPDHEEALATLQYATLNRKGFVLLTGEVGAGKTLIGRMFIRQIERQASTAVITHTQLSAGQLLAAICSEFELEVPANATSLQLADRLQEFLLDQFARDRFVVVLIDEGQNLPDESFEALRMLGNLEADDAKLLQVCILGQPELRNRFSSQGMKQLDQRLFRRFHLVGLTRQQSAEYIQRRLSVAGCARNDLFSPEALDEIYRGSQGMPRLINRICDNALLAAYAQGRESVDADLILQVLDQEGLNEPAGSPTGGQQQSADARTEERIEQIYGTRPELTESQARWADQLEEKLSSFQSTIRGELQTAARAEEVQALARAQDSIRGELQTAARVEEVQALAQAQDSIRGELLVAARVDDLKALAAAQETIRAEWSERLDRKLADLDDRLQSRLQTTANSNDIIALRNAQAAIREEMAREFQTRLLEMQQQLQRELECKVTTEQLEAIRESQAQARAALDGEFQQRLDALRSNLERELDALPTAADLEQLRLAAADRNETFEQLQDLRKAQAQARTEINRNVQEILEDLRSNLKNELSALPKPADLEQLRLSAADRTETFEQLQSLREAQTQARAEINREVSEQISTLRSGLDGELAQLARSADLEQLRSSAATKDDVQNQAAEVADQAVAIEDIYTSVGRHEDDIRELSQQAGSRFEELTRRLEELGENVPGNAQLDELRESHQSFASDLLDRFEQKADELEALRHSLNQRIEETAGHQDSCIADLSARIDEQAQQLREMRGKLLKKYAAMQEKLAGLDERYAARSEVESLRQAQAEQASAVLEQFQANRQAVDKLVEELSERFRATHQRLDSLASAAEADGADLAELRRLQAEDVTNLLRQLEDQRRASQEQFEKCLSGWTNAQQEIEALRATAADTSALEELRERQNRHSQRILRTIAQHRRDFEALIAGANQRCDTLLARLNALPDGIATSEQVNELAEESRNSKLALEGAIRSVAEQCDRTASALSSLEDRAAAVDNHLEEIRSQHAQGLDQLVQRIEGVSDEYQQEFDTLKQHWAGLRGELQELAGSTTPVEKFEAAERLINQDMDALKQRLDGLTERRQKDVRTLVDVVQRLGDRVKQLEELDRPQPVRVELRPRAAEELAGLNATAETKATELRALLADGDNTSDRLRDTSSHVEQIMHDWNEQSAAVQEQSDRLRASAGSAGNILQAMRKCSDAIDEKLNSPAWHGQLQRGEQIAARLEQTLPHYQRLEHTVQALQEQRGQADALIKQLQQMLTEANRATARLGRVGALMAGAAGRDGLAQTIEAAREHDEQLRPTPGLGRKAAGRNDVQTVTWPKYRTHTRANVG